MTISDTLTKRIEAARQAASPDPLITTTISAKVRNQVLHALWGLLDRLGVDTWADFTRVLRMRWDAERGVYDQYMRDETPAQLRAKTIKAFIEASDVDARDFIEIACGLTNREIRGYFVGRRQSPVPVDGLLHEVNVRLREARLAYRFEPQINQLVNIGSEYTHEAIVRPALNLLAQSGFEGASAEFATAFEQLGDGNWKDAVTAAGRAFEATMKAICTARGWAYDPAKSRAEELVTLCLSNGLLPPWLSGSAQTFVAMMKAGVPHVRNNAGAHGQAPDAEAVTEALARYAINQAAASMLLLLERHRDLGQVT